jgi:lipopolysaccharide transport system permease protein
MTNELTPIVKVRPPRGWEAIDFHELWAYRELIVFLAWRDVKVRYKRAALGIAWALLQPLMTTVIFTVIFGRVAGLPSEGVPYPLFTLAALIPWQLFSGAVTAASNSLIGNAQLVSKVYFPRLIVPMAGIGASLADFVVGLMMVFGLMIWYDFAPSASILALPVFLALALLTALGIGLWTSALTVRYRDVQYLLPFLLQVLLLASPVAYSSKVVPAGGLQVLYAANPLVALIEGFRWALLGTEPPGGMLLVSLAAAVLLVGSGLFVFRRMEASFADVV